MAAHEGFGKDGLVTYQVEQKRDEDYTKGLLSSCRRNGLRHGWCDPQMTGQLMTDYERGMITAEMVHCILAFVVSVCNESVSSCAKMKM